MPVARTYGTRLRTRGAGAARQAVPDFGGAGGLIATLQLVNTSGSTQAAAPTHMAGIWLREGDLPSGQHPQWKIDGTTRKATWRVNARWPDGSAQHISFILIAPSIAGSATKDVEVWGGGAAPVTSGLDLTTITGRDFKTEITGITNLTGTWTASVDRGISDNDSVLLIMNGEAGPVYRVRTQLRDSGNVAHGQLHSYDYVQVLANDSGTLAHFRLLSRIVPPFLNVDSPSKVKRSFASLVVKDGASTIATLTSGSAKTFTASGGSVTVTMTGHGLETGMAGRMTTTGTLPGGLSTGTDYYLRVTGTNTVQLYPIASDSVGDFNVITPSSAGSGTHTFTPHIEVVHFASVFTATGEGKYQFAQGGGSVSTENTCRWVFPKAYLKSTKCIPTWRVDHTPTAFATHSYVPNGKGPLRSRFGDTGAHPQIAVQPQWAATHFQLQTATQEQTVRVAGLSLGHATICVRNSGTGTVPVLNAASGTPYTGMGTAVATSIRWNGSPGQSTGFTMPTGDSTGVILAEGFNHWGGGPVMYAAGITGEPQYFDLLVETANYTILSRELNSSRNNASASRYGYQIFDPYQVREDAWAMANMGHAAGMISVAHWDAAGLHTYLQDCLKVTYDEANARVTALPTFQQNNGLMPYIIEQGGANAGNIKTYLAPWNTDYMIEAVSATYGLTKYAGAKTFGEFLGKLPAAVHADVGLFHWFVYQVLISTAEIYALVTNINQVHYLLDLLSVDVSGNTITVDPPAQFNMADGDRILITGSGAGPTAFQSLYARDVSDPGVGSNKTFRVATTAGGTAIDITSTSVGFVNARLLGSQPNTYGLTYAGDNQYQQVGFSAYSMAVAMGLSGFSTIQTEAARLIALDSFSTFANPMNDRTSSVLT
jgi:hypothetical protein